MKDEGDGREVAILNNTVANIKKHESRARHDKPHHVP